MNIDECFEHYEETGTTEYQIYEHTDGEWYLMKLDYNGNYVIFNIDDSEAELSDTLFTELESSEAWEVH